MLAQFAKIIENLRKLKQHSNNLLYLMYNILHIYHLFCYFFLFTANILKSKTSIFNFFEISKYKTKKTCMMLIFVKKIRNYTGYVPFYLKVDPWNILSMFVMNTTWLILLIGGCDILLIHVVFKYSIDNIFHAQLSATFFLHNQCNFVMFFYKYPHHIVFLHCSFVCSNFHIY